MNTKLAKTLYSLISLACAIFIAYGIYKLSGRGVPTDFVRPLISVWLVFLGTQLLYKLEWFKLAKLLYFVLGCFVSAIMVLMYLYYRSINAVFTGDDVVSIAQSNPEEIIDFLSHYIANPQSLIAVLAVVLVYSINLALLGRAYSRRQNAIERGSIVVMRLDAQARANGKKRAADSAFPALSLSRRGRLFCVVGGIVFMIASVVINTQLRPVKFYRLMVRDLENKIAEFNEISAKLEQSATHQATKDGQGELYVLIIGESLSRDSMGLYNHAVDNNPFLSKLAQQESTFVFPNAYSFFVSTVPSVTASFSQGNFKTGLTFPEGDNLIFMAKKAGITTYWVSNQVRNGKADTPIGAISSLADHSYFTTNYIFDGTYTQQPDMVLIPKIEETLAGMDSQKNNLLIIHLMGNHSPYYNRIPGDYPLIDLDGASYIGRLNTVPPFSEPLLGASNYEEYLTTIRYNDEVIKKIYDLLAVRQDFQAFVYYSDHGEEVLYNSFEDADLTKIQNTPAGRHNVAQFTFTMSHIPLVVHLSDQFGQKYGDSFDALKANQNEIFTNDTLYDFILDLMQVKSDAINYTLSPANASYDRGESHTVELLNHKIVGSDPDYIAFTNAYQDFSPSLAIASANSVFKANIAASIGYQNLHLNTMWHKGRLYIAALKKYESSFFEPNAFVNEVHNDKVNFVLELMDSIKPQEFGAITEQIKAIKSKERFTFVVNDVDLYQHLAKELGDELSLAIKLKNNSEQVKELAKTTSLNVMCMADEVEGLKDSGAKLLVLYPELSTQDNDFAARLVQDEAVKMHIVHYYSTFDSDFDSGS